jgi:hypothetical protein
MLELNSEMNSTVASRNSIQQWDIVQSKGGAILPQ